MLPVWFLLLISLAYAGVLFAIAFFGDKAAAVARRRSARPYVYSLSLAVYCTSWTYYGAVGRAASTGWEYLAIYVGPVIVFVALVGVLRKILLVSKRNNIVSIADFIASRYGKSQFVAALATTIAVVGTLPYIALQLKAVAVSFDTVTGFGMAAGESAEHSLSVGGDTALLVALVLAIFSILFGTRHVDTTESHRGMILAIAFESIVKLLALLAVGIFVVFGLYDGPGDLLASARASEHVTEIYRDGPFNASFVSQMLLAMAAILCLPRQFHVTVVENTHHRDLKTARWLFPGYLVVLSLLVVPIATGGMLLFPDGTVDADTFVLTLPMSTGNSVLALIAYLGGFSAATGMVIVASIALSTMVCNDIVMPLLFRVNRLGLAGKGDLTTLIKTIRRISIVCIALLAYFAYRLIGGYGALSSIGLLSFVALAQFAPAMLGGLYWRGGTRLGAIAGLSAGFAAWLYTLWWPALMKVGWLPAGSLEAGPFGIGWLNPYALFGLSGLDPISHGVFVSLLVNIGAYVVVSRLSVQRLLERQQAAAFVDGPGSAQDRAQTPPLRGTAKVGDLEILAERFVGTRRARQSFTRYYGGTFFTRNATRAADPKLLRFTERLLAGAVGTSSARLILAYAMRGSELRIEEVATILGKTSEDLQFNRELLSATLENISEGVSVVDAQLNLVAWNRRYLEIFSYPPGLIRIGCPLADLIGHNAALGMCGPGDVDMLVRRRLGHMQRGEPHIYQRTRANGMVIEMRGNPMPGGGFVTSFSDITEHKNTELALKESERNIRIYTDNVPVLITYIDADRRYRFVNKAYEKSMGVDREQILGRRVDEVLAREQFLRREAHMIAALDGVRQSFEIEQPAMDGTLHHALATYIPEIRGDGSVDGFYALFQDITERRQAALALREANENLEQRVHSRTLALSQLNDTLRRENEIRAQIEAQLRDAKAEAETANLSKTRFLAAASHDLLQPLNAARLFTSALSQQVSEPAMLQSVDHIDSSLRAAEDLLNALLDISKLDARAIEPDVVDIPLDSIMTALCLEFSALAAERGIAFHKVTCRSVIRSDRRFLRRILQNFLSNALRYTSEGRVLLGCRRQGGAIRIEVWDTGPGIPENSRGEIFEEFRRLQAKDQRGEKGMGLGLAIVERMTRMLGHAVTVRSWPGRGSVFSVTVPVSSTSRRALSQPAKLMRPGGPMDGATVLCIDNETVILDGMRALLGGWSCRVIAATSAAEALQRVEAAQAVPDIILADYHLDDGATGVEAIDLVRRHVRKLVPAVIITADYSEVLRDRLVDEAHRVMRKPVKPARLRAMMSQLLAAQRKAG